VLKRSLRPGGKLVFTDYCSGDPPWQDEFARYVQDRRYHLISVRQYTRLVTDAGFEEVTAVDLSNRFITLLQQDIERIRCLDCDAATRNALARSWQGKLARAQSGDHRWGLVSALAPH